MVRIRLPPAASQQRTRFGTRERAPHWPGQSRNSVERCEDCGHCRISYNSCRNRHCPKCQGAAAKDWLAAREADLLPVGYFHLVFTLPAQIAPIAYQNKTVVYDLLFRTATIAPLPYETAGPSSNFTNSGISRSPSIAPASNSGLRSSTNFPANALRMRPCSERSTGLLTATAISYPSASRP
jgi:hypothetical protein